MHKVRRIPERVLLSKGGHTSQKKKLKNTNRAQKRGTKKNLSPGRKKRRHWGRFDLPRRSALRGRLNSSRGNDAKIPR